MTSARRGLAVEHAVSGAVRRLTPHADKRDEKTAGRTVEPSQIMNIDKEKNKRLLLRRSSGAAASYFIASFI